MTEAEIDRFSVQTESGTRYTLSLIQEYRMISSMSGGRERIEGMRRYDLLDGGHANYIDDRTFKIVATGEIARRVS